VKLKRPGGQYSIYDDKSQGASDKKEAPDAGGENSPPK
jgi:hypothetical protein